MGFSDELRNTITGNQDNDVAKRKMEEELNQRVDQLYYYYMSVLISQIVGKVKDDARVRASRISNTNIKEISGRIDIHRIPFIIPYFEDDKESMEIQRILRNKPLKLERANEKGIIIEMPYPTLKLEKTRYSLIELNYVNTYSARFVDDSEFFFEMLENMLKLNDITIKSINCPFTYHGSANIEELKYATYSLPIKFDWIEYRSNMKPVFAGISFDYSIKL